MASLKALTELSSQRSRTQFELGFCAREPSSMALKGSSGTSSKPSQDNAIWARRKASNLFFSFVSSGCLLFVRFVCRRCSESATVRFPSGYSALHCAKIGCRARQVLQAPHPSSSADFLWLLWVSSFLFSLCLAPAVPISRAVLPLSRCMTSACFTLAKQNTLSQNVPLLLPRSSFRSVLVVWLSCLVPPLRPALPPVALQDCVSLRHSSDSVQKICCVVLPSWFFRSARAARVAGLTFQLQSHWSGSWGGGARRKKKRAFFFSFFSLRVVCFLFGLFAVHLYI